LELLLTGVAENAGLLAKSMINLSKLEVRPALAA
jgi:hypothetical protein